MFSLIHRERNICLTEIWSCDRIDEVGFTVVFSREFFEPAILEGSKDFHGYNLFRFDEEIVAIGFRRYSLGICSSCDCSISRETIISIAAISCNRIDLKIVNKRLNNLYTISVEYGQKRSFLF